MKKPIITITQQDHAVLSRMITELTTLPPKRSDLVLLEEELRKATIVPPGTVPRDVITLNSHAELLDLDTGELEEFTLTLPGDADIDRGCISILAPIGTGMLGYRTGDTFEQNTPFGVRRLKVLAVRPHPNLVAA